MGAANVDTTVGNAGRHPAGRPSPWLVAAAFAALYLFWGSTYLGMKWAVLGGVDDDPGTGFPPFFLAGARSVIAGAALYAYLRAWRGEARPAARHWRNTAVIGVLLLVGGNGLVTYATAHIPSGIVALLIAMMPIWMLLLEGPWGGAPLRERASGAVFAGMALGIGGVAALVWPRIAPALERPGDGGAGSDDTAAAALAVGAVLLSTLSWANGSLLARRLGNGRGGSGGGGGGGGGRGGGGGGSGALPGSPLLTTAMQLLCGGGALMAVSLAAGEWPRLSAASVLTGPRPVLAMAYLVVFGSLLGYSAYIWLLGVVPPSKVATYAYVNPIVAVVLGAALGRERLGPRELLASAAVIAGVVVIVTVRGGARGAAPEGDESAAAPAPVR
jgi:drug/metabolite transporter (DMT)-like permease